jgi:hypothetical protein
METPVSHWNTKKVETLILHIMCVKSYNCSLPPRFQSTWRTLASFTTDAHSSLLWLLPPSLHFHLSYIILYIFRHISLGLLTFLLFPGLVYKIFLPTPVWSILITRPPQPLQPPPPLLISATRSGASYNSLSLWLVQFLHTAHSVTIPYTFLKIFLSHAFNLTLSKSLHIQFSCVCYLCHFSKPVAILTERMDIKVKLSLCLTNYALRHGGVWGSGCIDPNFLDLGTSWR